MKTSLSALFSTAFKMLVTALLMTMADVRNSSAADANLVVTGFSSFQPTTISPLARPTSITYALQNFGPGSLGNLSGGTGPVLVDLWLSTNTSYGDGDDLYLGTMQFAISAPAGSSGTFTHSNPSGLSGFTIPSYANGTYRVFLRVVPAAASGLTDPTWSDNYALLPGTVTVSGGDTTRPTVTSIIRWNPPFQTNNAQFVTWLVNFSEPVMGIDLGDFTLVDVNGSVLGEFLGNVSAGGGSQVQVTANTGSGGLGDLRLDVIYPGATIADLAGNALTNSFTTGQVFTVDKVPPTVVSINRLNPLEQITSATSIVYRVTFSEPVMGVATDDFTLVDVSGTITGESITSVSASSGVAIDVTVNTGNAGNGDMRLDVGIPGATILDGALNSLITPFSSGQVYTIDRTPLPVISISGTSVVEGHSGTILATFAVALNLGSSLPVSVEFETVDGTAAFTDNDYVATNGLLTFAPGESNKTITVLVNGDTEVEPDETFLVVLSNPTNAALAVTQAVGTILNDDVLPSSFLNTSAMTNSREGFTMTLLPNGKVLAAGGYGSGDLALSTSELYDPATGLWTATGVLPVPRYNHTATLLPNGKVLVAGGYNNITSSALTNAALYDPATGIWTSTGSLQTRRYDHSATLLLNGMVLVVGGYNPSARGLASAELYDPANGTWTAINGLATPRYRHEATLLPNGKVLVAAGQYYNGTNLFALSTAESYDPVSGSWTATGALNTPRFFGTATLLPNGKVLAAGGYNTTNGALASAELYDLATGLWTATGGMSTKRSQHAATLLPNGKVLVTAGSNTNGTGGYLTSTELYDPATGLWLTNSPMNVARYYHTAALLPNGKVLVAGGDNNNGSGALSSAELYNSANTAVTVISPLYPSQLTNGTFQLAFASDPNGTNTVLCSTNLVLSNWSSNGVASEFSSGLFLFIDQQATNNPQRFYRVRSP